MTSNSDYFNSIGKNESTISSDESSPLISKKNISNIFNNSSRSLASLPRYNKRQQITKSISSPSIYDIIYFYDDRGKIKIDKLLGNGSYSSVYLGIRMDDNCIDTGERVALKLLKVNSTFSNLNDNDNDNDDNNSNDRDCRSEYDILLKYHQSDYIVEFFGSILLEPPPRKDNIIYGFSLEYCEHGDLNSYMQDNKSLCPSRSYRWMTEIIECISTLHNINPPIIHRDVKSLNFLIDSDYHIKITDFGLSRPYIEDIKNDTFKRMRTSLFYIPPEIVRTTNTDGIEEGNIYHFPSDVYSTTIVIWEILNWTLNGIYNTPFNVSNMWMVIGLLNDGIRPDVKDMPSDWIDFLDHGWNDDPDKRFTIIEMLNHIKHLSSLKPITTNISKSDN